MSDVQNVKVEDRTYVTADEAAVTWVKNAGPGLPTGSLR